MSPWLDPLRSALALAEVPVTFFFRDDDAGWGDDRLRRLLNVFRGAAAPIDLAAIPLAVSPTLDRLLARRHGAAPALVRVHQHGFAHTNHEPIGRKCEYGPSRSLEAQRADVARGRRVLRERLDVPLDPIFTPPWNRCTQDTVEAVRAAGLTVLSRESRADVLACAEIAELPVSVDWVKLSARELGESLAASVRAGGPVGVMLHHTVMGADDREGVAQLLALLQGSRPCRLVSMHELTRVEVAA